MAQDDEKPAEQQPEQQLESIAPADVATLEAALEAMSRGATFGPPFFVRDLPALIRERCPDPEKELPRVLLHLAGGDAVQVAHVIGLTPRWVALAVHTEDGVATEVLPYAVIGRVTIEGVRPDSDGGRIGFRQERKPDVLVPVKG